MVYVYHSFLMHLSANGHLCCFHNKCFQRLLYRRLLRVPRTARRSNHSILKEINPEYSLEEQMVDAEAPIFWPPDVKSWLTGKDPDAGKDRRQEEKGVTQNEMVGWHHQLRGHESEQAPGDSEEWKPGMLQSMGSQRVRHNLEIEQQQQSKKELKLF